MLTRETNFGSATRLAKTNSLHSAFSEAYSYDTLNRLTQMLRNGGMTATQDWSLDATGNWNAFDSSNAGTPITPNTSQTRTANRVNEITGITELSGATQWATPTYDAAGNMKTFPKPSSLANSYTGIYDAWNRLVQVKDGSTVVVTYAYDGNGRRVIRDDGTTVLHAYFSDKWQVLEERTGSSTSAAYQYFWGVRYVDELICRYDSTNGRLYAMQDANFNVTGIVGYNGSAWAVLERYLFDPYGARQVLDSSWSPTSGAYGWIVGFQGLPHDDAVGGVLARRRWSWSRLGTWGSRDPVHQRGALYLALGGNPISLRDPMGLCTDRPAGTCISGDECEAATNSYLECAECCAENTDPIDAALCFERCLDPSDCISYWKPIGKYHYRPKDFGPMVHNRPKHTIGQVCWEEVLVKVCRFKDLSGPTATTRVVCEDAFGSTTEDHPTRYIVCWKHEEHGPEREWCQADLGPEWDWWVWGLGISDCLPGRPGYKPSGVKPEGAYDPPAAPPSTVTPK